MFMVNTLASKRASGAATIAFFLLDFLDGLIDVLAGFARKQIEVVRHRALHRSRSRSRTAILPRGTSLRDAAESRGLIAPANTAK